jgi:hypothetical protein
VSARTNLVSQLVSWVGSSLEIEDLGTGWPSLATLAIDDERIPLALFVSTVTLSHRGRDAIERRFQNPSSIPLVGVEGRESLLVGIWESDDLEEVRRPVVALAEAHRRDDGRTTRWSVFLLLEALLEAEATGWASDVTNSGETIRYLHPVMLPVAITASMNRTEPNDKSIYRSISSLGLLDSVASLDQLPDVERVRRTVSSLVRDSKFSGAVLNAYERRCAMCGLSLGLVQGAHIYPASAPGSRDETRNGLALCANHHLAFDRYLIAVLPESMNVVFNPSVLEHAETDSAVSTFVANTVGSLRRAASGHAPDPQAFTRRYEHYREHYAWVQLYMESN